MSWRAQAEHFDEENDLITIDSHRANSTTSGKANASSANPFADYSTPYLDPSNSYSSNTIEANTGKLYSEPRLTSAADQHADSSRTTFQLQTDFEEFADLDPSWTRDAKRSRGYQKGTTLQGSQFALSKKTRGLSRLILSLKTKLGMAPAYSGTRIDIPLTEHTNSRQQQPPSQNLREEPGGLPDDNPDTTPDFDIRKIWQKISGKKSADLTSTGPRIIYINDPLSNKMQKFRNNHISTTKFNAFTFLPKFLFEQFSKYANLFFLFTSVIQQVPKISPTNRYTTIGTLAVVLMVSAVKEVIEDLKRANADKDLNYSATLILQKNGEFAKKRWIDVNVGDVIKVNSEEPFPADLVLLSSSEPEGLCYIETANLDGETNLKIKQSSPFTCQWTSAQFVSQLRGQILSEQPNSQLYTYDATLQVNGQKTPIAPDQLLLRGATLRNTAWVYGIVVFTGHETKLMRNATATPIKRTAVEHMLNLQILFLFTILLVLAFVSSIGNVIKNGTMAGDLSYLYLEGTSLVRTFFADLLTYWVLFSNLVPISLFVTVEIVKFYQAYLISSDLDMYYAPRDIPAVCRTSSLVEELGQIEYIFSDKTGTLTRNVMEFKSCSIAGRCYASEIPEDKKVVVAADGQEVGYNSMETLRKDIFDDNRSGQVIQEFFTLLAACHTVIPEMSEDGVVKYQAASPDEGALVEGAARLGFRFIVRRPKFITIDVLGTEYEYELLNICEFNSSRKRMSAIFRCPDGNIRLYCKGADTVILERLTTEDFDLSAGSAHVRATMSHLEEFAAEGLRTLCLAMRTIPENEYAEWKTIFDDASTTLENRAEKLDKAAELIEKDMFLLGATAIEDKLQEGVPETIHTLQDAGIKIWVLTGDRQETAINIGMSCRLLSEEMILLMVNESTYAATRENILKKLEAIRSQRAGNAELDSLALIIDGKSLSFALDRNLEADFLELAVLCKAVICCRVSPLQKALVVKLVKRNLKALLLAIGDGANDVSMIQAAHVGVGISGMEGMQAARSADISIGQFRYLRKLLLVHGSWNYSRLSNAILYSFYKNIALYMTQFWFVFLNGFSGQSIYESWTITFYNVFFTVLPPFVIGVFDQFISARLLDRYPQLYQLGQRGVFFTVTRFWQWILNGFFHSILIFLFSIGTYHYAQVETNGLVANHWTWGTALYTTCVLTVLGKAALITNMWNKWALVAIPGSFAFWLVFFPTYSTVAPLVRVSKEYRGVLKHLYGSVVFWALVVSVPFLCLIRDFAWKYYKRMYHAETYHHVQEIQKYNIADYRPRMERFQKAIRKFRQVHRMRKQRGFAFSQSDDQSRVIRAYDTDRKRGVKGSYAFGNASNSVLKR